jgi:hypothetical protein
MEITKVSFGKVFNHSTVKYESIAVFLTFECNGEMDVVELNVHYIDTDGTRVLSWLTFDDFDARYYLDTVSSDVCDYLNGRISEKIHGCSAIRTNFEVTDELCNYIDNVVDETMKKYKIKVEVE